MLFNSWEFLIFFPAVVIIYFLLSDKSRSLLLLAASCIFYMAFIPKYILILFFLILVDYSAGIIIERSKGRTRTLMLIVSIISNVGILSVFKYFNFFTNNINDIFDFVGLNFNAPYLSLILPIGLSFHVFQSMSYTIEVYKGKWKAERNLATYALYVMFFPQLVAGPIERPYNLLLQLNKNHIFDQERVISGLRLMLWGFFKKVVIADRLALVVDSVYTNPSSHSGASLLLATYLFAYQIYCDFSGYSDIAIGAARVMGFNLMNNFSSPYLSKSVSEFWTRWHISLSSWFRDYLYIPLGGNRVSKIRWCFNILLVFAISGFWHGADWKFVIWGTLHGFFILATALFSSLVGRHFHQAFKKNIFTKLFSIIITFNLVSFAWIFFRARSLEEAFLIVGKVFVSIKELLSAGFHQFASHALLGTLINGELFATLIFVAAMEMAYVTQGTDIWKVLKDKPVVLRWSVYYLVILVIIFFGEFKKNKFIYFQF